jgi:hypothetical protein
MLHLIVHNYWQMKISSPFFGKKKTVSTQIIRVQGQQSAQHQRRMFRDETIYFKKTVEPEKAFLFLQN